MDFAQQLVNGVQIGSVYALVAIGYTMVYGIAKMINFAHGDIIMVGSYVALLFFQSSGLPVWGVIAATAAVSAVLGVTIERLAYKPAPGQVENVGAHHHHRRQPHAPEWIPAHLRLQPQALPQPLHR